VRCCAFVRPWAAPWGRNARSPWRPCRSATRPV